KSGDADNPGKDGKSGKEGQTKSGKDGDHEDGSGRHERGGGSDSEGKVKAEGATPATPAGAEKASDSTAGAAS
ncbi:MAG TPA: hypothetical protein VI029_13995, partial [Mycobacterium sp.]